MVNDVHCLKYDLSLSCVSRIIIRVLLFIEGKQELDAQIGTKLPFYLFINDKIKN